MKRKIFEGKCPWDNKKTIKIFLVEEVWQQLHSKFGLFDEIKVGVKRWWQGDDLLNYFLLRFFKIKTKRQFTFAEYYYKEHLIILYPEITIFIINITAEGNLKKIVQEADGLKLLFVLHLTHEFGHALDRFKILEIHSKIEKVKSWTERMNFLIEAKKIFEERAEKFKDEYGALFINAVEVEIS